MAWADLPKDIVERISESLLAEDVTYYIRFRRICDIWRRITPSPVISDARFRPRNWILVSKPVKNNKCRFLNISSGKYITATVPEIEIAEGKPPLVTEGILVLSNTSSNLDYLLNPFTGSLITLPPHFLSLGENGYMSRVNFASPTSTALVATYRSSIKRATLFDTEWREYFSYMDIPWVMQFQSQLFSFSKATILLRYEFESETFTARKLSGLTLNNWRGSWICLLDLDGEMVVVGEYSVSYESTRVDYFRVFTIELPRKKLIPRKSIGNFAIFVKEISKAFCISTETFPTIKPGSIYYCRNRNTTEVYHQIGCTCHPQFQVLALNNAIADAVSEATAFRGVLGLINNFVATY